LSNGAPPTFRDLNENGRLDPYEDPGMTIETWAQDLLRQITIEEKAGPTFYPSAYVDPPPRFPAEEALDAPHDSVDPLYPYGRGLEH
jgi:beta-glucosidase